MCVCVCVCIIFEISPPRRANSQSYEVWRSIFGIRSQCFGDEHYLKQSFKLNFTEAKLFHLKFLGFYKRGLIFSLAVNRTGFRFHSCWKKRWDWKATRKIALKISEAGQNLRFNFYEFIIIFMEIFTNNDKHFYLFTFKNGFSYVTWMQKRHKAAKWLYLDSEPLGDVFDPLGLSNITDKHDNKSMSFVIQDEYIIRTVAGLIKNGRLNIRQQSRATHTELTVE